jgi:hypothetical protein
LSLLPDPLQRVWKPCDAQAVHGSGWLYREDPQAKADNRLVRNPDIPPAVWLWSLLAPAPRPCAALTGPRRPSKVAACARQ